MPEDSENAPVFKIMEIRFWWSGPRYRVFQRGRQARAVADKPKSSVFRNAKKPPILGIEPEPSTLLSRIITLRLKVFF